MESLGRIVGDGFSIPTTKINRVRLQLVGQWASGHEPCLEQYHRSMGQAPC